MPNKYFHKIFVRKIELSICVCFAKQTKKAKNECQRKPTPKLPMTFTPTKNSKKTTNNSSSNNNGQVIATTYMWPPAGTAQKHWRSQPPTKEQ